MTAAISQFLAILTIAAQVALVALAVLFAVSRFSAPAHREWTNLRLAIAPLGLWIAWLTAAGATAGSLYYSEAARYTPCEFCWYQRIAIYPMVLILGIAALRRDSRIAIYAAPLALAGAVISAYHYQLQRFPAQASEFCDPATPCSFTWVWEFHYISIPMMALTAGLLIAALVTLTYRADQGVEQGDIDANDG